LVVGGVVPSGSPESLLARIEGVLIPSEVELKAGSKNEITYTFAECDFSANVVNARRRFGEIRYSQRAMARRTIR
jgi:hypothetical protein